MSTIDSTTRGPAGRLAYSPKEAAELIGLPLRALYRYIDAGHIPARRIGNKLRIPADFIDHLPTKVTTTMAVSK